MKLEQLKNIIDNINNKIDSIEKMQSDFNFKPGFDIKKHNVDSSVFVNSEDFKRYCYLDGKIDLLKQISNLVLYDTCFEEIGDLGLIKKDYPDTYADFLDGFVDSFLDIYKAN